MRRLGRPPTLEPPRPRPTPLPSTPSAPLRPAQRVARGGRSLRTLRRAARGRRSGEASERVLPPRAADVAAQRAGCCVRTRPTDAAGAFLSLPLRERLAWRRWKEPEARERARVSARVRSCLAPPLSAAGCWRAAVPATCGGAACAASGGRASAGLCRLTGFWGGSRCIAAGWGGVGNGEQGGVPTPFGPCRGERLRRWAFAPQWPGISQV
eukprot:364072-Chlamydomonas_euryale.AAC.11